MRVLLALLLVSSLSYGTATPNVPAHDPVYEYLDRLEAYGCLGNTLRVLRPLNFGDVRQMMFIPEGNQCKAPDWLLNETKIFSSFSSAPEARIETLVIDSDTIPLLGIEATVTPSYPLREGRPTVDGPNIFFEGKLDVTGGGDLGLALSVIPAWRFGLREYSHASGLFYLQRAYFKAGYKKLELTVGKTGIGFGDGKHGSLLLSAAAKPLSLLKLAIRPHILGSGFGFFGPFSIATWVTAAGESDFVSGARLWGIQMAFRPAAWFELGLLEIHQIGGAGTPSLNMGDLAKMAFYAGGSDLDTKRNRGLGIHFNTWLSNRFAKVYVQTYFNSLSEFSNWFSDEVSFLAGTYLPKLGKSTLRLEYVSTVPNAYKHPVFTQGLTYDRLPIGHPLGPDAEGYYVDFGIPPISTWRPILHVAFEKRLKSLGTATLSTEKRYSAGLEIKKRWMQSSIGISGQYSYVDNHKYVPSQASDVVALYGIFRYTMF